jgi:hypothetical protein
MPKLRMRKGIWQGQKMAVFWDVAPRSLVEIDRRFRGASCLHHEGDDAERENGMKMAVFSCSFVTIMRALTTGQCARLLLCRKYPSQRLRWLKGFAAGSIDNGEAADWACRRAHGWSLMQSRSCSRRHIAAGCCSRSLSTSVCAV